MGIKTLSHEQACRRCSPDLFDFSTTSEIEKSIPIAGQDRAMEAVEFGIAMEQRGFNLFVIGPQGKIRYGVNGAIEWDSDEVVATLEALIEESAGR